MRTCSVRRSGLARLGTPRSSGGSDWRRILEGKVLNVGGEIFRFSICLFIYFSLFLPNKPAVAIIGIKEFKVQSVLSADKGAVGGSGFIIPSRSRVSEPPQGSRRERKSAAVYRPPLILTQVCEQ